MDVVIITSVFYWQSFQRKTNLFFLGDFNKKWLKYEKQSFTNKFLALLDSHMLLRHILQTIIKKNYCKTLADSTYSNVVIPNYISEYLTGTVSDHLQHFFIAPGIFSNPQSSITHAVLDGPI